MATSENLQKISMVAGADLSSSQFCFVHANASGEAVLTTANGVASGVLYNDPISGRAAEVAIDGVVKVLCGAAVTAGGPVASDAAGKAKNAAAGNYVHGTALETGADGRIISVLFHPRGPLPA